MRYQPYPRYTPSDVAWVGEIPDGWQELRLKFVGDAIIGLTYDPDDLTDELGGTLVLRANNIQDRKLVADDPVFVAVEAPERLRTKSGDILICSRNGSRHLIGKNAQVKGQFVGCYFGAFNTVFRSPVNNFLFHVFNSSLFEFQSGSYLTSTINQLTLGALNSFVVPLPPAPEQQQIAAFLDWKTGQIDALIGKKKELLEKLKEKRIAAITQAVTQGLNPAAPKRDSGTPWLHEVPEHWQVIPLGFLMTMSGGLTPSMANTEYWEGDIPWVTPKDMKQPRISDSIDRVTQKALEETAISLIPVNAVLIVVRGMILAHSFPTAVNDIPVTINQDMKALRAGEKLEVEYLFWTLTGFAKVFSALAQESAHGTRKMETETIKKFCFPVPPKDEQRAITRHLEERLRQLDTLSLATENTIDRLTEYRTALITAATTGKIDVRKEAIP